MKRLPIDNALINRSHQLIGLLKVCERAANSLDDVGDGRYRDSVTNGLALTMELAESIASDIHSALEENQPRGGDA